MTIYSQLRELAKSIKSQNLFLTTKEISSIRLFKNTYDLSKLQILYLSFLYNYEAINRDIIIEKISKHVLDSEIMEEAYLLWKSKNRNKSDKKDNNTSDLSLSISNKITFPGSK